MAGEGEDAAQAKVDAYNDRFPEAAIKPKSIRSEIKRFRNKSDHMEFGVDLEQKTRGSHQESDGPEHLQPVKTSKGAGGEHIGTYAQDFQNATGLGDGKSINVIDALGVTMGAVPLRFQRGFLWREKILLRSGLRTNPPRHDPPAMASRSRKTGRRITPHAVSPNLKPEVGPKVGLPIRRQQISRKFNTLRQYLAEREGFEPPIQLPVCRISSAVLSTTQPPLRVAIGGAASARGRRRASSRERPDNTRPRRRSSAS